MNDNQLLRYSRHILLDEIGIEGQQKLLAGHALIIGAGGLGSPAALYLASAGVGHITLVDDDAVDLTNLQRQIAHTTERVGLSKAESARTALLYINPDIEVTALIERADDARLSALVQAADVVLDCTDNFATRHAVNRACVQHRKPLVSGAVIRFDGQVSVFDPRSGDVFEVLVLREQTGVARRGAGARVEHAALTVEADHGTRHQGLAVLDGV